VHFNITTASAHFRLVFTVHYALPQYYLWCPWICGCRKSCMDVDEIWRLLAFQVHLYIQQFMVRRILLAC